MVTHDLRMVEYADRSLTISDGVLEQSPRELVEA
jgi:ABC-type lipoprotein export system ATPase subunit